LELPLAALQRAEIAFPRRGPDLEYVFKHVSMREVAYNTLVQKRRQALHLATAQAIASLYPSDEYVEVIAYHYGRTDEHREAAKWLEKAGDRAAGVYANETAIGNYQEARRRLELAGAEQTAVARLDEKLGDVLATLGRYDEGLDALGQAVEVYREVRDLEAVARVTARIGWTHRFRGTPDEGIARIQPLMDLLAPTGPSKGLAALHLALAYPYFGSGRYQETLEAAERAAELARAVGDERILGGAEMRRGTALDSLGQTDRGRAALEGSIPLLEAAGDLHVLGMAINNLASSFQFAGDLHQSRTYLERSVEIVERVGHTANLGFQIVNIGEVLIYLGEWNEAGEHIELGADIVRSVGASWYAAYPTLERGYLSLRRGDWEAAARNLREAISLAEPVGDSQALEFAHWLMGQLELMEGRAEAAHARLEPLIANGGPYVVPLLTTLAWSYLDLGELDQAEKMVGQALATAKERQHQLFIPGVLRVQGMILTQQGNWVEAESRFAEAISMARSMPYPYEEACALYEYGLLDIAREEPAQGRERLQEAAAIFRRLGAQKDVERAEQALATPDRSADLAR
jgi:tetratricopeptide (TPR) repeat protein